MRRFLIVFACLASTGVLAACGSAPTDWTYASLENFDPAHVSMLPHNPYQEISGALSGDLGRRRAADRAAAPRPGRRFTTPMIVQENKERRALPLSGTGSPSGQDPAVRTLLGS